MLLGKIFCVPISTPTASLYLETGCIPIRYLIKLRRIMYLHHILTRDKTALITRAFWAQVRKPVKGDWCIIVKEDIESIGLGHLTYDNISTMKEDRLRTLVKDKIRKVAYKKLLEDKEKRSKMKQLNYTSLSLQSYLSSKSGLTNAEKRSLFRWRNHMTKVSYNYGAKDALCPVCKKEKDTQEHLLSCPELHVKQSVQGIRRVMNALRLREVLLEQRKTEVAI